jgi:hypothetical protein
MKNLKLILFESQETPKDGDIVINTEYGHIKPIFILTQKVIDSWSNAHMTYSHLKKCHFLLVDTEAEINEGDLVYRFYDSSDSHVGIATPKGDELKRVKDNRVWKIVASTNQFLEIMYHEKYPDGNHKGVKTITSLPEISDDSIDMLIEYIDENNEIPEFVGVEEDMGFPDGRSFKEGDENHPDIIKWLNINWDGTIDINIPEETNLDIELKAYGIPKSVWDESQIIAQQHVVTYEIASKLKELGFDDECLYSYFQDKTLASEAKWINYNSSETLISAPLWQQAIDFFREEKNIIVKYSGFFLSGYLNSYWQVCIENDGTTSEKCYSGTTDTIEESRVNALLKAIKLCNIK